jgi:thioredoxin 1
MRDDRACPVAGRTWLGESTDREEKVLFGRFQDRKTPKQERNVLATIATTDTFEQEVLQSDGKVIVDFWAEWCGPCHAVSPVLDRIADEHDLKLVKVNIDEQQDLAMRYGVASIPFMVLFEDGQPQASAVGAMPKGSLEKALGLAGA